MENEKMSLQKPVARIKEGVKEIQSLTGVKRVLVYLGIGAALGVIVDLIVEMIWWYSGIGEYLNKAGYPALVGFTIFPNNTSYSAWNPTTKQYETKQGLWMAWDDLILLIVTIALLFSRKFWLVIGFFLGWYSSSYFNLYDSLGLPRPAKPAAT